MPVPRIMTIEGQGGNIKIGDWIIQVSNWTIRKMFRNSDVTTTGSGGWAENKRVLAGWDFSCDWPYDINKAGVYEGVKLVKTVWVAQGLEYPVAALCKFQLGAAGTPLVPGTNPYFYYGNALIAATGPGNPAHDVVHFQLSGQGTGPLFGPEGGWIG